MLFRSDNENNAGSVDAGFITGLGANGTVYSIQLATNGQSLLAGDFTTFNGVARQNVARINTDGTLDNGFDAGVISQGTNAPGTVRAIGVYTNGVNANKVVIGGLFTLVGNAGRTNIARLNVDGTPDTSFDPGTGANNAVNSVAIQNNGRVLLGGTFTAVNGVPRNFVARLNFDGSVDNTFTPGGGPDAQVRLVAALNDGKILIAGDFDSVSGVSNRRIARLNADGSVDPTFLSRGMVTNGTIYNFALQINGQILIAGMFTATNGAGVVRTNIARLNADGTLDRTFDPGGGPDDFVATLTPQADGKIVVGGAFANFDGYGRSRLVRLFSNGGVDPTLNIGTGADNLVAALAIQSDGKILVGGAFTNFNGVVQNRFTRLHGGQNAGSGLVVFGAPLFTVSEAGTNATIQVLRTGGTSNTISVDYSVIPGGTAIAGVDYLPVGGTLIFNQGETLRSFVVPVIDDAQVRPSRTVFLTLSNATGGASLDIPPTTVLQIEENDSLLAFASGSFSIAESGTNAVITVVRSGGTNEAVTVDYFTAPLTATPLADYTNVSGTLAFAPGVRVRTFLVPIVDDALVEGSETVGLFLTNAGPVGIAALGAISNASLTIVDNDFGVGVLGFASTNFNALENAGFATITIVRTNGSSGAVSVNFATVDGVGTATAGVDYRSTNGILTFADGEVSKSFNVPLLDDVVVEGNETVGLVLLGVTGGAGLGLTNATLTIVDDDAFGTFQFSTNSYSVVESAGSVTVTVNRIGGIIGSVAVGLITTNGTATPGVDYLPVVQVLNFAPGQTTTNISISIINDQIVEPVETFDVVLTGPTGGALLGAITNATVSITDDDMQFTFALTNFTVLENAGTAVINVLRYGVTNSTGTVAYATSDSTAFSGVDYVGVTNTLTFLPGVTNTNFTITVIDNQIVQLNRALNLRLFNATPTNNASPGTNATATLTIVDNDSTFSFSASAYNVNESAGQLTVAVLRAGQSTGNVSVVASTVPLAVPNAATAGTDYVASASTLFFAPGQSSASFTVLITSDPLPEGNEVFGLILTNPLPVGSALLGPTNTAIVTIIDDEIGRAHV